MSRREKLESRIRAAIWQSIALDQTEPSEIAYVLTSLLPSYVDRGEANGQVLAAYDLAELRPTEDPS